MCRCSERRDALVQSVTAFRAGDTAKLAEKLAFVAKSSVEDAAAATRRILQARLRLGR